MPPLQAFAYPLLLAATYGVYRVGRGRSTETDLLARVRLVVLAMLMGVILALQVRFMMAGYSDSPLSLWVAALSIAAVIGLVALNMLNMIEAREAQESEASSQLRA